ncbi:hypothetical protein Tco_0926583 [Tanacetum coccineum]|uniref:Uncharacterized protein n=1 Tax=Tanacetum coccineum TaxID=301880 RepID=A0ABQ5DGH2_9ASTR
MMEADRLLTERLQSKEREELTDEEKAKLFMELMEKRRKYFAALRAGEGTQGKREKQTCLQSTEKNFKCLLIISTWESKEKKEEGREEITKGSRKKMLGRKRAGKEQHCKKRMEVQEILFNDKNATKGLDKEGLGKLFGGYEGKVLLIQGLGQ